MCDCEDRPCCGCDDDVAFLVSEYSTTAFRSFANDVLGIPLPIGPRTEAHDAEYRATCAYFDAKLAAQLSA